MDYLMLLGHWLAYRTERIYTFFDERLQVPEPLAWLVVAFLVILFVCCLYDLFLYRDKGETAAVWLIILLLVPLSPLWYFFFGRLDVRRAPTKAQRAGQPQKRYLLGAHTLLGSVVFSLLTIAGTIWLGFGMLLLIMLIIHGYG